MTLLLPQGVSLLIHLSFAQLRPLSRGFAGVVGCSLHGHEGVFPLRSSVGGLWLCLLDHAEFETSGWLVEASSFLADQEQKRRAQDELGLQ